MDDNIKQKSKINLNKKLDLKLNLQNINGETIPTERKKPNTDREVYSNKPLSPRYNDPLKTVYLKSSNRKKVKSPTFPSSIKGLNAKFNFSRDVYNNVYLSSLTPRDFVVKKPVKNLDRLYSAQKLYNNTKVKPQLKMTHTMPIISKTSRNVNFKSKDFNVNSSAKSPRVSNDVIENKSTEKPLTKSLNRLQFLTYK
jgi:hypothetical protein